MGKKTFNAAWRFLLQVLLAALLSGCMFDGNADNGSSAVTFTTIAEFAAWLEAQPRNTPKSPYTVALYVDDLGGDIMTAGSLGSVLKANDKYDTTDTFVSLDLSGSAFTSIGDYAFYLCTSLTGITIPSSVTGIGDEAFAYCTSLAAIDVAAANTAYNSVDGVLYDKDKTILVAYPAEKQQLSFSIPDSVTGIGKCAFYGCTSLASVTIPNSVTSIGDGVFSDCTVLTSVTFKGTISSIEDNAFGGDLCAKFYAMDSSNGTPGTYTTTNPGINATWMKQP